MKTKFPVLTLILLFACGGIPLCPAAREILIQNREAVLHGDWWRLLTGNLVHHSTSHLFWNCLVIAIVGTVMERRSRSRLLTCLVGSGFFIGPLLYILHPAMTHYAGMSGIATALVACTLIGWIVTPETPRWIGITGLSVLIGKLTWESLTTTAWFTSYASTTVVNIPEAHWIGLAVGSLVGLVAEVRITTSTSSAGSNASIPSNPVTCGS